MLLSFGKIHAINKDHPILNPTLDKPMDFYNGYYYIKEAIEFDNEVPFTLEPGFLEVYISYTSAYEENINTEFYINYKHITNDGKIYTWRYYLHKEEETIYRLNKNERPSLILTKNKIDNLLYTEKEMSNRFLSKEKSGFEENSNFVRVPILTSRRLNEVSNNGRFNGNKLYKDNTTITSTNLNKKLGFNKLFKIFENKSSYIDDNIHPKENFDYRWKDLFNLGSIGLWDDIYNKGLKVSNANGRFYPSHRRVYGIIPNINLVYSKLGEYFSNIGSISSSGEFDVYTINHNTYLPGIIYGKKEESIEYEYYRHPRNFFNMEECLFYMVRILDTPDPAISKNPIVFYGNNNAREISYNTREEKYEIVNPTGEFDRHNFKIPYQWEMGMLTTVVHKKNDLELLFDDYVNNVESNSFSFTRYAKMLNKNNRVDWGSWFLNNNTSTTFKDDLHLHLFDTDPNKVYYRSHSTEVDNDNYINRMKDLISNGDSVTDIRLGPEAITTYDKSEINLNSSDRFINIVNEDPSMALTYLKLEINKKSPRYTLENQNLCYELAYPEQETFTARMTRRFKLKDNEKLGIDKITVGFRPIQVKINNVWKNITKRGVGR